MRRKIKLDLSELAVETFRTEPAARGGEGTVLGNAAGWSNDPSCAGTCDTDCWGMCGGNGGTYGCGTPTMDPQAAQCYSVVVDCPQTDPVFYCGETAIVYCNPTAAQCWPATSPEHGC